MHRLTWRIWKALIISAVIPALPFTLLFPPIGFGVFIYAFLIALVLAFPSFIALRRFSSASEKASALLVGAAMGVIFSAVFFWPSSHEWLKFLGFTVAFGLTGLLAGFVFWYNGLRPVDSEVPKEVGNGA